MRRRAETRLSARDRHPDIRSRARSGRDDGRAGCRRRPRAAREAPAEPPGGATARPAAAPLPPGCRFPVLRIAVVLLTAGAALSVLTALLTFVHVKAFAAALAAAALLGLVNAMVWPLLV